VVHVSLKIQRLRPFAAVALACFTAACATNASLTRVRHADPAIEQALAELAHPKAPMRIGSPHSQVQKSTLDGAMLNGLGPSDITTILGTPNRIRKDIPAQVWQYNLSHCYVDIFFFDENPQDQAVGYGPRVVYVQERARQVKKLRPGLCLNKVWEDQRKRRFAD